MGRMRWKRIVMVGILGGVFLGAGNDAPTCNASCKVALSTKQWTCSCQWSVPFGLSCSRGTLAIPAGARVVSPANPSGGTGASSEVTELTGGKFEMQEGRLVFIGSHDYEIRQPYSIPYQFEDQNGKVLQTGAIAVTEISMAE